ncbi:Hsp33 family molecular chaperone HslO [Aquisalimonas asiatica]|uniref:33 kDa chaperonin n=1 Tax=Aquisalimonas asiatica TaxID=406100 RepID=A0A1H8VCY6_9GAMM|nr:Hsp33 family molecular chaperone HslO [Aquisalimonas asiatica]SEP13037.1 molecular chaperone Hsp33 [Aquisalimonas asiatica]
MSATPDQLHRFVFEHANVRGELIHLDRTFQDVLARRQYPDAVTRLLGEALAASGLLSSILKFKGSLILQLQGQGALPMLVASASHEQDLRGIARLAEGVDAPGRDTPLNALCEQGYLAITIDPDDTDDRYQGIVPLETERLSEAVESYFSQSEQLPTRVWLACDGSQAAGLLMQRLPDDAGEDADAWNRAEHLAATITEQELLELGPREIIGRLFHEEDIRLFEPGRVRFNCHCSRERLAGLLQGFGYDEARSIVAEQGEIEATCEFCGHTYRFDSVDVEQLFSDGGIAPPDDTQH